MRGAGWEPARSGRRGRAASCRAGANRKPTASPPFAPLCTHTFIVATSFGRHIREELRGQGRGRRRRAVGRQHWGLSLPARSGDPTQPHVLANGPTQRISCDSSHHRDTDNANVTLSSHAVTSGLGEGTQDGLRTQTPLSPVPRGHGSPASPHLCGSTRARLCPASPRQWLHHPGPTGLGKRQFWTEEHPAGEPGWLEPLHVLRHEIKHFLHFLLGESDCTGGCLGSGCRLPAEVRGAAGWTGLTPQSPGQAFHRAKAAHVKSGSISSQQEKEG